MPPLSTALITSNYVTFQGWARIVTGMDGLHLLSQEAVGHDSTLSVPHAALYIIDQALSESTYSLIDRSPHARILAIAHPNKPHQIRRLHELGVKSILTPCCGASEIEKSLFRLCQNQRYYCSKVKEILLNSTKISNEGLSKREIEVLRLIAQGATTQQIAEQLFVSTHTINSHRKNMLRKLQLTSPVELIVYAVNYINE